MHIYFFIFNFLTVSCFLIEDVLISITDDHVSYTRSLKNRSWELTQNIKNEFIKKWKIDYLPSYSRERNGKLFSTQKTFECKQKFFDIHSINLRQF